VKRNVERANPYVLAVFLLSTALFFAAIGVKLHTSATRAAAVAIAWVVFLTTVIWLATFPVSL
jgi:hypothetical protein